jgi:transcriptional regulator with XRE-family HTH domain
VKVPLNVREVAEAKGFTAQTLREATGLAYNTVLAYWRDDIRQVNWNTLTKIANVLGVKAKDLIKDNGGDSVQ